MGDDDLILWSDGTRCTAYDLQDFAHMGDDYQRIREGSPEYDEFFEGFDEEN